MSDKFVINVSDSSSCGAPAAPELPPAAAPASAARAPAESCKRRADGGEAVAELVEPPQTGCSVDQAVDSLSSLPPELLAIIIRKLDTLSVSNLQNTCKHIWNVVHTPGVVKKLDLSLSTLATVKTKLDIFHDISGHVRVLNLSGVYDLDLPALVRALEHMESLVDLDVSFTNISMIHFLKFRKVRPTLKSLAINYDFNECLREVCEEDMLEYQQAFEGFRTVHFVYTRSSIYHLERAAILMLRKADLLRFTITFMCDQYYVDWYDEQTIDWNILGAMRVSQFQMNFLERAFLFDTYRERVEEVDREPEMPLLRFMEVDKSEIIIFVHEGTQVLATPLVQKIIWERFAVQVGDLPESTPFSLLNTELLAYSDRGERGVFLMLWHRERCLFDEEFRSQLLSIFKEYYVFSVSSDTLTQVPPGLKWHTITHVISPSSSTAEFYYGDAFKEYNNIHLDLSFDLYSDQVHESLDLNWLKVINNLDFLKKISHLSLSVSWNIPYHSDIFNIIFEHCESLVTFQATYSNSLRFIDKSKSLKNIYFEGNESDLRESFVILSECRTLERFVFVEIYGTVKSLPDPNELFRKCDNLYYICIKAEMRRSNRDDMLTFYNNVKSTLGRYDLTIDIRDEENQHKYTPYMNVFNVSQFRPM